MVAYDVMAAIYGALSCLARYAKGWSWGNMLRVRFETQITRKVCLPAGVKCSLLYRALMS